MAANSSDCVVFDASAPVVSSPASLGRATVSAFVTRRGSKLFLQDEQFKAVGPNVYWLGLDENINQAISYPTPQRVLEIMATAAAMGATSIRSTTLGVSVGHPLAVEPSLGVFNEPALKVIDYALYAAHNYGIRVIIPLTDQWDYYHGGKLSFLRFRNLSTTDDGAFYTNRDVVTDFKQYIGTLVNRTNSYTNVTYGNDPTVLAWETGNELKGAPASWTDEIASYIKNMAPSQLVMDGSYGPQKDALDLASVDIYSNHYYPPEKHKLNADVKLVSSHDKAYYVGEYDTTDKYSRYGLLACLIPLVFVIIAFCLPSKWFPWTFHLPRWLSFQRRSTKQHEYPSQVNTSPYSPLPEQTLLQSEDETSKLDSEYPPAALPIQAKLGRRKITIRKWMFALSFLLLVPFAAWIALEMGPTSLDNFLGMMERKEVAGSAYWSLFGRDDTCCRWVEHDDGFTVHYRQQSMLKRSLHLTRHAYRMSGATAAFSLNSEANLPVIGCPSVNTTLSPTGQ